jgi:hypothetical protein
LTRISSGDGEPFLPALDHAPLRGRIEAAPESRSVRCAEASNFVIVSGPDSGVGPIRRHALAASLNTLGRFAEPIPGTFLLRSDRPLSDVRRSLASAAPDGTQLLICEPRDAKPGWTGLFSEGAEAVRAAWDTRINPSAD